MFSAKTITSRTMEAKIKRMWSWLIDQIPASHLDVYAWRFGFAAVLFSLAGGLCGWIVLDIRDHASRLRAVSESERSGRLKAAEQELSAAKAAIEEASARIVSATAIIEAVLNWDALGNSKPTVSGR